MSYQGRLSGAEPWTHDGTPGGVPIVPSYFRGPNMATLGGAFGSQLDSRAEQILQGRMAAIPFAGGANPGRVGAARLADGRLIECAPLALQAHAADRGILTYPTQGELALRVACSQWHQLHQARGTHWGEIMHARAYFADQVAAGFAYPRIAVVFQDNEGSPAARWYQVDAAGNRTLLVGNFNYDGFNLCRSRVWAFIDMTGTGYTPPETYDSGGIYDASGWRYDAGGSRPFTAAMGVDVAAMFFDWKAAHSWLAGVVAVWPQAGGAPFPTAAGTPTQDATGWWSLPNGAGTWSVLANPGTGLGTRPPNFIWLLDSQAPII